MATSTRGRDVLNLEKSSHIVRNEGGPLEKPASAGWA